LYPRRINIVISVKSAKWLVGLILAGCALTSKAAFSPEEIYAKVSDSVLTIQVENSANEHFIASGFLALGPGLAVTAWHVVHDATNVEAWTCSHQKLRVLGLVAKDELHDLAVLAVEDNASPQTTLSAKAPHVGARAYVIGAPRGLDFSITDGLVSQIRMMDDIKQYQLSCPISPGNSGGPVVNDSGEIIGVVSWRKTDAENLSFATPASDLLQMNVSKKPAAWPQGTPIASGPSAPVGSMELSRSQMDAKGEEQFHQALSACSGKKVTVTLDDGGKSRTFTFEVSPPAAHSP
jgi:S1-C subfamily serine protease